MTVGLPAAPTGKRMLEDVFDFILVPVVIGFILGFLTLNAGDTVRNIAMIAINVVWLVFRDAVFSPGRAIVGLKVVSLTGSKVSLSQAFIRNVLLIIPVVLLIGYFVEFFSVLARGQRVADAWSKTQVVSA